MNKWTGLVALACLLIGSVAGSAQFRQTTYGPGTASCGAWSSDGNAATATASVNALLPRDQEEMWMLGFLSGVGSHTALKRTDGPGIVTWVDTFCARHPLESLATAARILSDELQEP